MRQVQEAEGALDQKSKSLKVQTVHNSSVDGPDGPTEKYSAAKDIKKHLRVRVVKESSLLV